jgi:hypothetical protein
MEENDANRANFEELKTHIEHARDKLASITPTSPHYAESQQNLEDYYERAVQDRTMRITTMELLFKAELKRWKRSVIVLSVVIVSHAFYFNPTWVREFCTLISENTTASNIISACLICYIMFR